MGCRHPMRVSQVARRGDRNRGGTAGDAEGMLGDYLERSSAL